MRQLMLRLKDKRRKIILFPVGLGSLLVENGIPFLLFLDTDYTFLT